MHPTYTRDTQHTENKHTSNIQKTDTHSTLIKDTLHTETTRSVQITADMHKKTYTAHRQQERLHTLQQTHIANVSGDTHSTQQTDITPPPINAHHTTPSTYICTFHRVTPPHPTVSLEGAGGFQSLTFTVPRFLKWKVKAEESVWRHRFLTPHRHDSPGRHHHLLHPGSAQGSPGGFCVLSALRSFPRQRQKITDLKMK